MNGHGGCVLVGHTCPTKYLCKFSINLLSKGTFEVKITNNALCPYDFFSKPSKTNIKLKT